MLLHYLYKSNTHNCVDGFSVAVFSGWRKKDGFIGTCFQDLIIGRWLLRIVLPAGLPGARTVLGFGGWCFQSCAWALICGGSVSRAGAPQASPGCSSAEVPSCSSFTRRKRWPWRWTTRPSICWRQTLNSSGSTFGTEPFSSRFVPVILAHDSTCLGSVDSAVLVWGTVFLW